MKKFIYTFFTILIMFLLNQNVYAREKMQLPLPLSYKTTGSQYISGGGTTTQTLTDIYIINQNNRYQTPALRLGNYNGQQYTFTANFYFPAMGYQSANMTLKFYYNHNNVDLLVSVGNKICDFDINTYTAYCENVNIYNSFQIEVYQNDSLITENYYDNIQLMYEGSYIEVDYANGYDNMASEDEIILPQDITFDNSYITIFYNQQDSKYYLKTFYKSSTPTDSIIYGRLNGVPTQSFNSGHSYYCSSYPTIGCQSYLILYAYSTQQGEGIINNASMIWSSNTLDFSNSLPVYDSNSNPLQKSDLLKYSNIDIYISSSYYSNMSQYYQNNFKWFDLDNYLYTIPTIENRLYVEDEHIKLEYKITQWDDLSITKIVTGPLLNKTYTREEYLQNNTFSLNVINPSVNNVPVWFYDNEEVVYVYYINLSEIIEEMPQDKANEIIAQEQYYQDIHNWEDGDYSSTIKNTIQSSSQVINWARELIQYIYDSFPQEVRYALITGFIIFLMSLIVRMIWR